MSTAVSPLLAGLGPQEVILILLVVLLLFGAKKLPELARGSGRALRIFKAETKGLMDDDDDEGLTEEQRQINERRRAEAARAVDPGSEHQPERQPRSDTEL